MAKPIPKVGSRRSGRSSARKSARRIPKGVIHVQASFNNTIVTVTDVRGRVISWSSTGTCGFKGTRRGTPFAAQTAAGNAIRAVVDQGMQRAEVMIKGPGLGRDATLRAIRRSGPGYVTAQDIILPPSVEIVDNTQHIASLTEPIDLCIGLQIERNRGYGKKYHSGNISKGVANGSAGSPIIEGSRTAKPMLQAIVPRITTGKIYKRSLGHAGSP
ncbi:hypothetical protein V6N13_009088 [Hibiscus sabdariffa]